MSHWKSFAIKIWNYFFLCRFQQGLNKNGKFDVSHYGADDHKPFVNCYIPNVVQTYKVLMEHRPKWHDSFPHLLLLIPKTRLDLLEKEWFMKTLVEKHTLCLLSKCMIASLPKLKWKKVINKISCGIAIARMLEA
jgi:hypothetical protein